MVPRIMLGHFHVQGMFSTFNYVLLALAHLLNLDKHYFKKVIDPMVCSQAFAEMGDVMYLKRVSIHLKACLTQDKVEREALHKICQLHTKYLSTKPFFDYINAYWAPKVGMWCIGVRNIWYANKHINATIEAYHDNLKERLKNMMCRLEGWRLD